MGKKLAVLLLALLFFIPVLVMAEEGGQITIGNTKIGGHVKFTVYDSAEGTSTYQPVTYSAALKTCNNRYYTGMGFSEVILYITQEINEFFEIEAEPTFSASTSATPKMGTIIGSSKVASPSVSAGIDKALLKYRAPWEIEMKLGVIKPIFTMEYGYELFWEEEYNGGKFSVGTSLAQMHDMGLEIYRPFYIGDISLPVYLYILNGSGRYADSNMQPGALIHIEPEWGVLKLSGSFYAASTDNNFQGAKWFNFKGTKNLTRWSAGGALNWQGITIRSEFSKYRNERAANIGTNAKPVYVDTLAEGYYIKFLFRPDKMLRLMYHFDCARNGGVDYITHTPGFQFFMTDTTIAEFQCDIADWRKTDGKQTLIFTRPTLGIRVTF